MSVSLEGVAWGCVAVLGVGVIYESLVATEVVSISPVPGEGAPGAAVVAVASMLSLLAGVGASVVRSARRGARRAVWPLLPLAGTAYMVAQWETFDPYYAPTLRRYSDGGVTEPWIVAVGLGALVAAGVSVLVPRLGAVLGALVLVVEALTVFVMPFGK